MVTIKNNKNILSLILSLLAISISCITVYWNFWRPGVLEVALPSYIYVGNEIGCTSKLNMPIAFRVRGAEDNAVIIQDMEIELTNETSGKKELIEVTLTPNDPQLPLIIRGNTTVSKYYTFQLNENFHEEILRVEQWLEIISKNITLGKSTKLEEVRKDIKNLYFGKDEVFDKDNYSSEYQKDINEQMNDIYNKISSILRNTDTEFWHQLVFITPGKYHANLNLKDPFGKLLYSAEFKFNVDAVLSKALRSQFQYTFMVSIEHDGG